MSVSPKTDSTTAQRVLDVLMRIEARHADPARWCTQVIAQDASGHSVGAGAPDVHATCLFGAEIVETLREPLGVARWSHYYLDEAQMALYPHAGGFTDLNDRLGYEAVRAVEKRAVELAEAALAEARP